MSVDGKVSQLESESELYMFRVGTHTSPIALPCSSMWTMKMIVESPYLTSIPWKMFVKLSFHVSQHGCEKCESESVLDIYGRNRKNNTYYCWTCSGFPSALRVSTAKSISALSSTDIFSKANLAAALRCWKHLGSLLSNCSTPSSVFSSSSTASLRVSQTKSIALTFMFRLDWVTFTFGRQLFRTQAASS